MTIYAFFDVDGTLTRSTTMKNFLDYFYHDDVFGEVNKAFYRQWKLMEKKTFLARSVLNRCYYKNYAGLPVSQVGSAGYRWFEQDLQQADFFQLSVLKKLRWHQEQEHQVVFVSGAFEGCLKPLAEHLKVSHILCTHLESQEGIYSGNIVGEPVIGVEKVKAIKKSLPLKMNFKDDYAYGDHLSDRTMLSLVGNPVVVEGDRKLEKYAHSRQWKVLSTSGEK